MDTSEIETIPRVYAFTQNVNTRVFVTFSKLSDVEFKILQSKGLDIVEKYPTDYGGGFKNKVGSKKYFEEVTT